MFVVFLLLTVSCFVYFVAYYSKWEIRDIDNLKLSFMLLCNEEIGSLPVVIPVYFRGFRELHGASIGLIMSVYVYLRIRMEQLGSQ